MSISMGMSVSMSMRVFNERDEAKNLHNPGEMYKYAYIAHMLLLTYISRDESERAKMSLTCGVIGENVHKLMRACGGRWVKITGVLFFVAKLRPPKGLRVLRWCFHPAFLEMTKAEEKLYSRVWLDDDVRERSLKLHLAWRACRSQIPVELEEARRDASIIPVGAGR